MKTFFYRAPTATDPGYTLAAGIANGALRITSTMPACRDPRPHTMLNITLPADSLSQLADIIAYGGRNNG